MSNYYASYFYRIDFVVIPSYTELPCSDHLYKGVQIRKKASYIGKALFDYKENT